VTTRSHQFLYSGTSEPCYSRYELTRSFSRAIARCRV